ncbi:MAG: aspartate aminotransferase family protein [Acidobacteria bacterium]|nr:aspartate aminotransferase family protein [Acidobacteriota bacterium]
MFPSSVSAREPLRSESTGAFSEFVNPQWVKLLNLLQMNVSYTRCSGAELHTSDGRCILDFLSGYCVHNPGHNHPGIVAALQSELQRSGPAMLQSHVPEMAGELAAELCRRAGGRLGKVFFCSSGSEGVEASIKFARAHTRRTGLVYCSGGFHGLTCGALSLMGHDFWRKGFGPMLQHCREIAFNDLAALEDCLASRQMAGFIVEPVQGEAGVVIPSPDYLEQAGALCRKYGTLFILDEVQTGLGRTGAFLAAHQFAADPDMVVLAKALSGGLIPSGAVLMTNAVHHSVYGSLNRALVHTSTYSENSLAMRAGLATLEVLDRERLAVRAESLGSDLRRRLAAALSGYEMVREVRGLGLMCAVEFSSPRQLRLRIPFASFGKIHPAMFGLMVVMRMFQRDVLTQVCGNNFMVLKVAPPLVVTDEQIERFVSALQAVMEAVHAGGAFWSDALKLAQRALAA